jgi:hypothetical protein
MMRRRRLHAAVFSLGQRKGTLSYKLVPTASKGPRHPQGRSELASGAGRAAALTGNVALGASRLESGPRFPTVRRGQAQSKASSIDLGV